MSDTLRCPHCLRPCATLRDLLTCHPRALRAYTEEHDRQSDGLSFFRLLTVGPNRGLHRRVEGRLARHATGGTSPTPTTTITGNVAL